MNLSRRSILTSLIAAPAVIAADRLMPIKLWLPTIYGDAVHDDWEGLQALIDDKPVNILARIYPTLQGSPHLGMTSFGNTYLLSNPLHFRGSDIIRNHFINDTFKRIDPLPRQPTIISEKGTHDVFLKNHFV